MKKTIIAIASLSMLTGCSSVKNQPLPERPMPDSWNLFCAEYGYDPCTQNSEIENEYLDCWAGSVEEEKAIEKSKPSKL